MIDKKYKLFIVEWRDSYTTGQEWVSMTLGEKIEDEICMSIGWLINESETHLQLCPNFSNIHGKEHHVCNIMTISKNAIIKKRQLK